MFLSVISAALMNSAPRAEMFEMVPPDPSVVPEPRMRKPTSASAADVFWTTMPRAVLLAEI
jgi:hypothetical protein